MANTRPPEVDKPRIRAPSSRNFYAKRPSSLNQKLKIDATRPIAVPEGRFTIEESGGFRLSKEIELLSKCWSVCAHLRRLRRSRGIRSQDRTVLPQDLWL